MNNNDPVKEYKVLKKINSNEAMNILKRISSQVKPILIKRNWKIQHLCEFFPSNPNLLGVNMNRGWRISIRLRPHFDESRFLEYEDILGTLLHEMAHIKRGPHDEHFYKLLDELKEETEVLMATGYNGEGFYSEGHQLGGSTSAYQNGKAAAAAAAEKRLQMSKIMLPSGGIKLGGGTKNQHLTPAQQAALAAEKRRNDQIWCGGSITEENTTTKRKSTLDDSPLQNTKKSRVVITIDDSDEEVDSWSCPSCTFLNTSLTLMCKLCLTKKPHNDSWTCPQCTLVNDKKWQACVACTFIYLK